MSEIAFVYGNGESRMGWDINQEFEGVTTWGCNAIYRDGKVNNLVAVDYNMQQEIYESEYALDNTCWFLDWNILPKEFTQPLTWAPKGQVDLLRTGFPKELIFETRRRPYNKKTGRYEKSNRCVVQGKNPNDAAVKLKQAIEHNPDKDPKELEVKLTKNCGLYICWLANEDKVKDIEVFKGRGSGATAMYLACHEGAKTVFMFGFDMMEEGDKYIGVYKNTENYYYAKGFDCIVWRKQYKSVFNEFEDTTFYWVCKDIDNQIGKDVFEQHSNVKFITYEELNNNIR